jgi:hypothetical protein
VDDFRALVDLTDSTYRDAAAMHTSQRQIPVRGGPQTEHFRDVLPVYEKELDVFQSRLKALGNGAAPTDADSKPGPLPQVQFFLASGTGEVFIVKQGESLYDDSNSSTIARVAPELDGLKGIRVSTQQSEPLHFTLDKPAQILVGFFKSSSHKALNVSPATEQWNILLPNAVMPSGKNVFPVTVWTKTLPAGKNDLDLGKGAYVVLGFISEDAHVTPHVSFATSSEEGQPPNLDWMFED